MRGWISMSSYHFRLSRQIESYHLEAQSHVRLALPQLCAGIHMSQTVAVGQVDRCEGYGRSRRSFGSLPSGLTVQGGVHETVAFGITYLLLVTYKCQSYDITCRIPFQWIC